MHTSRVLLVVTSADRMTGSDTPTGVWLDEAAAPYYTFRDARCEVTVASPKGGAVPIDPTSLQEENLSASTRRFDADVKAKLAFANSVKLSEVKRIDYDAIYFPGGHGTMEDLPNDASVRAAVEYFYAADKPLASVCHGPACLVRAHKANGEPLVKGHRFTCFTDEEERLVGLDDRVPFLLQSTLIAQGGKADVALPFAPQVVVSSNLITGQNPASSIAAAEAVIHQLRMRHAIAA